MGPHEGHSFRQAYCAKCDRGTWKSVLSSASVMAIEAAWGP
jgi:hypothetical protein